MKIIETKNLNFWYGDFHAFRSDMWDVATVSPPFSAALAS